MRKFMYGIKEMLYAELEELAHKENLSRSDLEDLDLMAHSLKNIMKICEMDKELDESSSRMVYEAPSYTHEEDDTPKRIEYLINDSRLSVDDKSILKRAMDILRK